MNLQDRLALVKRIANRKTAAAVAAGLAGAVATLPAHAAIDVTAVVSEISDTLTPIGTIGAAVLLVVVGIAAFKWVRRAIH
ncbi:Bacteriophage coat protein B [Xylophilus ampelinus]|nr:Bacteriophage coat protein B [Xylophilus ampelinus]